MENYEHLLTKHGILVSFDVAKQIKPSQISAIRKKLEKKKIDPKNIEKEIDKEITKSTEKFLATHVIPGLKIPNSTENKIIINPKVQQTILSLSNKIVVMCKTNNFTKEHVIFMIQAVLHMLKITNEDMQKFKQKYNINQDNDEDYLDDEDDDDKPEF